VRVNCAMESAQKSPENNFYIHFMYTSDRSVARRALLVIDQLALLSGVSITCSDRSVGSFGRSVSSQLIYHLRSVSRS